MDVASLLIGALLGGLISWIIAGHFHRRSGQELEQKLDWYRRSEERKNTLEYFELMLLQGTWRREFLDNRVTWICEQNATLKIVKLEADEPFDEEWTQPYPDSQARRSQVELRINNSTVKVLTFVHLDGHRIVVPMPRRVIEDGNAVYFWEDDSLEYKVGQIVGEFDIYNSIDGVAEVSGVSVIRGQGAA